MYRSKFTVTALAITFFLLFSFNAFGDPTKDGEAVAMVDTTAGALKSQCASCPNYLPEFEPPTQESFSICFGSTIEDTIVATDVDNWQTLRQSML